KGLTFTDHRFELARRGFRASRTASCECESLWVVGTMRNFRFVTIASALALVIAGCGGGGESKFSDPGTSGGSTPPPAGPTVSTLSVLASTPTIQSDGATPVDISVYARDASNAFVSGKSIAFTASSGGLQITQA